MTDANETAGSRSAVTSVERASDDLWKAELWQGAAPFRPTHTPNGDSLWRSGGYWLYIVLSCLCGRAAKVKVVPAAPDKWSDLPFSLQVILTTSVINYAPFHLLPC